MTTSFAIQPRTGSILLSASKARRAGKKARTVRSQPRLRGGRSRALSRNESNTRNCGQRNTLRLRFSFAVALRKRKRQGFHRNKKTEQARKIQSFRQNSRKYYGVRRKIIRLQGGKQLPVRCGLELLSVRLLRLLYERHSARRHRLHSRNGVFRNAGQHLYRRGRQRARQMLCKGDKRILSVG